MDTLHATSRWLVDVAVISGTVAFAVSGASVARRRQLDWLAAVVLAVIAANGGGTIRDVLLDVPVHWVGHPWPVFLAAGTGAAMIVVSHRADVRSWRLIVMSDAVGLAVFTMLGTDIALHHGASPLVAAGLGVISGTGGGVIRDVLAGDRPLVLTGEVYAVAALAGALLHVALVSSPVDALIGWWVPVLATLAIRLLAIRRSWSLPRFGGDPLWERPAGDDDRVG